MSRRALPLIAAVALLAVAAPTSSLAAVTKKELTATSQSGATISVATNTFTQEKTVTVTGKNFDETVGIYLAYCVVPKKGAAPTPCGGGIDKAGITGASYWISSNPPPYGVGLAIPFKAGGRFSLGVKVSKKIGKFDCRKVRCAIAVRSDHLHEGDRSHDNYIPIKIK